MLGVILAAGKATRLPNKALLPIADGKIAIESAIETCRRSFSEKIVVVVDSSNILKKVLYRRGHRDLEFVVQPEPDGVMDAITRASVLCADNNYMFITFCDNVYPLDEPLPKLDSCKASYRKIKSSQLDGYVHERGEGNRWVERSSKEEIKYKFAGWLVLAKEIVEQCPPETNLLEFMNKHKVEGIECPAKDWDDIGTVNSYLHYLQYGCLTLCPKEQS